MFKDLVMYFRWNRVYFNDMTKPYWEIHKVNYVLGQAGRSSEPKGGVTVLGRLSSDRKTINWTRAVCDRRDRFHRDYGRGACIVDLDNNPPLFVTENLEYPIAKRVAILIANTKQKDLVTLDLNTKIEEFKLEDSKSHEYGNN